MGGVQIEDDTGPGFSGPGQEGLVVAFNHPDGPINQVDIGFDKVRSHLLQEIGQGVTRDVNFRDHLRGLRQRTDLSAQLEMMVVNVGGELMGIGPVNLAVGPQIIRGVLIESLSPVQVAGISAAAIPARVPRLSNSRRVSM